MSGKVLVAYAGMKGGTDALAQAIGDELRRRGHQVDVRDVAQVRSIDDYHVVIVGSAIYARRWRRSAVRFLHRYADQLRRRQVWLFHSGAAGPNTSPEAPRNVERLARRIDAVPPATCDEDRVRRWAGTVHEGITAADVSEWSLHGWQLADETALEPDRKESR